MEIKPFKAFRFDETIVGGVGNCIAPPYDVISPVQQEQFYGNSEYNIVRIIKGKTAPSDNHEHNQYTRAADYLNNWIEKGALRQDAAETIYAYVQDFELAGSNLQRSSLIALAKLEEFGKTVRPHERTLNEPRVDRLNLKKAASAQFGLVFMLYEDEQKTADKIIERAAVQKPLIDFVDEQDVRHRLFSIMTKDDIDTIVKMMLDKHCIIADGHHRYETALSYYKETANPGAGYQMVGFANTHQDGLIILAAHRLVSNLKNFSFKKLIAALKENFEITEYAFNSGRGKADTRQKVFAQMRAEYDAEKSAFGIYGGDSAFYVAVLKDRGAMDSVAPDMSHVWRSLDVSVLHKLILEGLLGIGEQQLAEGSNVEYIKGIGNAVEGSIQEVEAGRKQLMFFLNPTKMQQIQMVTAAGERMPQKSTFFYPKMYTGLTINKL